MVHETDASYRDYLLRFIKESGDWIDDANPGAPLPPDVETPPDSPPTVDEAYNPPFTPPPNAMTEQEWEHANKAAKDAAERDCKKRCEDLANP